MLLNQLLPLAGCHLLVLCLDVSLDQPSCSLLAPLTPGLPLLSIISGLSWRPLVLAAKEWGFSRKSSVPPLLSDIWRYLETFLVMRRCTGIYWAEAKDGAKHPKTHRTDPRISKSPSLNARDTQRSPVPKPSYVSPVGLSCWVVVLFIYTLYPLQTETFIRFIQIMWHHRPQCCTYRPRAMN